MKGLKRLGLGLIAAAAVAVVLGAGLMVSSQVSAQDEAISVGDGSAAPGEQGSVELDALNIPSLGAWTIDVAYDPMVVTAVACDPELGAVCNTTYAPGAVRVSGASAMGAPGGMLATITFRCEVEGSSALTPTIQVLADATVGDPQDIDADTVSGTFTCAVPPTPGPTDTPAPAATEVPPAPTATVVLPPTGTGSDGSGSALGWLIAALAGAGLAAAAGFGALRLRARRS